VPVKPRLDTPLVQSGLFGLVGYPCTCSGPRLWAIVDVSAQAVGYVDVLLGDEKTLIPYQVWRGALR